MAGLEFIAAVYNEEKELADLIAHVSPYVDKLNIVDDGSTDKTEDILDIYSSIYKIDWRTISHTGLPETVKNEALRLVTDGAWVLMLDADERFAPDVLRQIETWLYSYKFTEEISSSISHVYFRQLEIIDNVVVREFQKSKLFKKEAIQFPLNNIHMDDQFTGDGLFKDDWVVYHRKSTNKQVTRETEYLATYKKLLLDGYIDAGRYEWLTNLHHFVKPKG